jgi:hypothetical protein
MLPGGTNAAENGADVRFGPDTPARGGELVSGRIMMIIIVLPVMLRDSSPLIQYTRGQEDGWLVEDVRTCWYVVVCHVDSVCVVSFGELV